MKNFKRVAQLCGIGTLAVTSAIACRDADGPGPGLGRTRGGIRTHQGPAFPGAGTSGAGFALSAGNVTISCNQPGPYPGNTQGPAPGATAQQECYYDADHADPAATMEWIVESAPDGALVHVRLTFSPWFVDNTYGANAIGWNAQTAQPMPPPGGMMPKPMGMGMPKPAKPGPGKGGHTFKDLVGSDHAEFTLRDAKDMTVLKFKADYLTESSAAPSGYESLGVTGGEGKMLTGNASDVVAVSTSLDRNLNQCGLDGYLVDSPATDDDYTPNAQAPDWDFRVVYDVWVKQSAFANGFGKASVEFVHASPSKLGTNTIDVVPKPCPSDWPPYCNNPDGCASTPGDGGGDGGPGAGPGDGGSGWDGGTECVTLDEYCEANPHEAGAPTEPDASTEVVIP